MREAASASDRKNGVARRNSTARLAIARCREGGDEVVGENVCAVEMSWSSGLECSLPKLRRPPPNFLVAVKRAALQLFPSRRNKGTCAMVRTLDTSDAFLRHQQPITIGWSILAGLGGHFNCTIFSSAPSHTFFLLVCRSLDYWTIIPV